MDSLDMVTTLYFPSHAMHGHMCTFSVGVAAAGNLALALYGSEGKRTTHLHTESQVRCSPDKYGYAIYQIDAQLSDTGDHNAAVAGRLEQPQ